MNPYKQAMEAYRDPSGLTFDEMMSWLFNTGFVYSTPLFFICGRPVISSDPRAADISFEFDVPQCDAWYIHLAAGDLSPAWDILPWPLPLIGFDRQGEVRFYQTGQVRRLTQQPPQSNHG